MNEALSELGIHLVAIDLGLFSKAPVKLLFLVSNCYLLLVFKFSGRNKDLELSTSPSPHFADIVTFRCCRAYEEGEAPDALPNPQLSALRMSPGDPKSQAMTQIGAI